MIRCATGIYQEPAEVLEVWFQEYETFLIGTNEIRIFEESIVPFFEWINNESATNPFWPKSPKPKIIVNRLNSWMALTFQYILGLSPTKTLFKIVYKGVKDFVLILYFRKNSFKVKSFQTIKIS